MGTHVFGYSHQDSDRFSILAKGYVVEGSDKGQVCEINAQIALQADHRQAFQMWCLLRSLFTPNSTSSSTSQPSTPPLSPLPLSSSISLPIPDTTKASSFSDCVAKPHSPYLSSGDSPHPVSSAPASNSPSPRRVSSTTQVTASPQSVLSASSATSSRPPSLLSQRPSNTANTAFLPSRSRALTSFRRPSVSTFSLAPSDNSTSASLRHVGEGTLDSDSSDSDSDISSLLSTSALSPTAQAFPRMALSAAPSPLSRVAAAGQHTWTEDEREVDEDSPSPASTETESEGETARKPIRARSQSLRRRTGTRSRSSTLAVPPTPAPPLQRPGSRSSMRTVTAHDDADHEHFPPVLTGTSRVASRVASIGVSDGLFAVPSVDASDTRDVYARNEVQRRVEEVREVIRKALQEALEEYADAGDVQTCAMMALVASRELGLGRQRVQLFVEAYIGTSLTSRVSIARVLTLACRVAHADEAAYHRSVLAKTLGSA
jgi:hypothetical protein